MTSAPAFRTREARVDAADEHFLWLMNLECVYWRPDAPRLTLSHVQSTPEHACYVAGWGRLGDSGVIAEAAGRPVGAAWWRLFTEGDHGYGFIDASIPEVSIAVSRHARSQGIGNALMTAVIAHAEEQGYAALSLSVEFDNPALRLYERHGFQRVGQVGGAWTLRRNRDLDR